MARKSNSSKTFSKTDPRFWESRVFLPKKKVKDEIYETKTYSVRIQVRGHRETFSTGESSKREAGKKALEIYLAVRGGGWEDARLRHKGVVEKITDLTVGEFLREVEKVTTVKARTFANYCSKFRRIVADIAKIKTDGDIKKYDYVNGGTGEWRRRVDAAKIARITPEKVNRWKVAYLSKAGSDPRDQQAKRRTVNTFIRSSKALFSEKNREFLKHLEFPDPLPFDGVAFEKEGSYRYRSQCDPEELLSDAWKELHCARAENEVIKFKGKPAPNDRPYTKRLAVAQANSKKEAFKVLLLALSVGLRRDEIDKLQWCQFDWGQGHVRIEATDCFEPKADSSGDVPVDEDVLRVFREWSSKSNSRFVIEGGDPKPDATYRHYRANRHHQTLIKWLREKGICCMNPIHAMRKEYGTLICKKAGIHAASLLLRHSSIQITAKHYVDNKRRVVSGLGSVLQKLDDTVSDRPNSEGARTSDVAA